MALAIACQGLRVAVRCNGAAVARRVLPSASAALPAPMQPLFFRSASSAAEESASSPSLPRFETLQELAAWDLPAKGVLMQEKARPQQLKQIYPERELTRHESSLFIHDEEREKLPRLQDHGYRFLTAPDELHGRPEAVKRALSTFTASIPELRTFRKSELIRKFRMHTFDTGSARVQVAILSEKVEALQRHLAASPHDKSCKRSLQMLVHKRRRMLQYLMHSDFSGYRILIREMGMRALPVQPIKFASTRGQKDPHKTIRAKHARLKRRRGRGQKGH